MATHPVPPARRANRWSPVIWTAAGVLLLLPAIAMRFDTGVDWTGSDFVVAGAMLAAACGAYEIAARMSGDTLQRAGFAIAVLGALAQVWANLAVGLVGDGANPANLMFMGVVGVAVVGTLLARFRAAGMVRAMLATAGVHLLVGAIAAASRAGSPHDDVVQVIGVTLFFAMPWLAAAVVFAVSTRRARRV